jgi:hypothetical protein
MKQGLVHHVGNFPVLEDQLCAFTTQGYRGEGSPDHADALVFAITELMLKENAAILEYYRWLAGARERAQANVEVREPIVETVVRLRVPNGASAVHGRSGALYLTGADGIVAVQPNDAPPLVAAGFFYASADSKE